MWELGEGPGTQEPQKAQGRLRLSDGALWRRLRRQRCWCADGRAALHTGQRSPCLAASESTQALTPGPSPSGWERGGICTAAVQMPR